MGMGFERMKNCIYLHRNLSTSFPAHMVASATFIEKTRIFPVLSLKKIE